MGGIWLDLGALGSSFGELVGYKAGLALTKREFTTHLRGYPGYSDVWKQSLSQVIRVRSEVIEEIVAILLYRLGRTSSPSNMHISIRLLHAVKKEPEKLALLSAILERWFEFLKRTTKEPAGSKVLDPTPFVTAALAEFGADGARLALDLVQGFSEDLERSPWSRIESTRWKDVKELKELFTSQSLDTQYGKFLAQRFIDQCL